MIIRRYSELITLHSFEDRLNYLNLQGLVGEETFGCHRYLNQMFYRSYEWKRIRDTVIIRDMGKDLAMDGYEIYGKILVHHMNPLSKDDIISANDLVINPEYLITTCKATHDLIHYGNPQSITKISVRKPNDTCPWRK